jgi:FAD/FMN-containing dehydrogenase/Fe-S oxidoreductase
MRGSTLIDPRSLTVPPGSASRGVLEAEARWRAPHQLEADLRRAVRGEVRFDRASRALYSTDASNFRAVPIGVVVPEHEEDVMAALAVCHRHGAPVLPRGGGTSLAGQCCNVAIVFDFSKRMHRVIEIDPDRRLARVQPGASLDDLRQVAARWGLTFGPDPSTHQWCTIGGMIGNNACGVHSVQAEFYGPGPRTSDNVAELEVATYDGIRLRLGPRRDDAAEAARRAGGRPGQIHSDLLALRDRYESAIRAHFPAIPRRVSGYNLPMLLPEHGVNLARAVVGSEGTCVTVLEAVLHLIPQPPARVLVVLGYEDVYAAADAVPEVRRYRPIGLEGMDDRLADDLRRNHLHEDSLSLLPDGRGWLLVELGGEDRADARAQAEHLVSEITRGASGLRAAVYEEPDQQERLWLVRESGLGATANVTGERPTWEGWEDSAVPPERFGAYLREFRTLLDRYGYRGDFYGHFGQGCLHTRIDFGLTSAAGIRAYRSFLEEAADLVVQYGGSLSGEHGDGQTRGELLARMYPAEVMEAFRAFKRAWDPDGSMNPGKLIDARPLDRDLRLGAEYSPPQHQTYFDLPEDKGSLAKAALRCVGVGKCRRTDTETMCPSYMVTREEKHTTRGRAHLLVEMMEGDPLEQGWQSEAVHEALDLCLACKGCKGECPVQVDMATYKAEFLAHYYEHQARPRTAYAFGHIWTWARLVSRFGLARLVNTGAQMPGLRAVAKLIAGMPQARRIPPFAPQTFRTWFEARPARPAADRPPVILWPDTFNDHFHPGTLRASVEVLESLGFDVRIPRDPLCCGRPLYDFGMLPLARRRLTAIMESLGDEIRAGVPIVGLEPSCVSVLRDELPNLFSASEQARRLTAQTFTLAEFLDRHPQRLDLWRLERRALLHGHCHQKALFGMDADRRVLEHLGLRFDVLDSGCCGMAGAFGFEAGHYDVSMAVGERVLLPAVRTAPRDTLIVADGFSCREQIAQATERRAMHLAEVVRMAMTTGPRGPSGDLPERALVVDHAEARLGARELAGVALAAAGLGLAVAAFRRVRVS